MKTIQSLFTATFAALISACGGGGGSSNPVGDSGGNVGNLYTPTAILTTPLVSSVAAATYAAGSEELAAFNLLNTERKACGFGQLKQNTALDSASKAHADWLLLNNATGHYEIAGTTGFKGLDPIARIVSAGYAPSNTFEGGDFEVDTFFSNKVGLGKNSLRMFLNAPYHAVSLLTGYSDIGFAVRSSIDLGTAINRSAVNMSVGFLIATGQQSLQEQDVATYPCQGTTDVEYEMRGENPNPVPSRDMGANPLGSTFVVMLNPNKTLAITSALLTNAGSGAQVALREPVGYANDPNLRLKVNQGYVAADAPLNPNTTYQMTVAGTNGTVPFNRTFTFTTKP